MDGSWSVDSTASAQFFLGSAESSNSVNVGVGRVNGMLNSNYPDDSSVDRSIYPADEGWARVLDSRGGLPSDWRQGHSVSPIAVVDRAAQ
jgi:hypothetical protein